MNMLLTKRDCHAFGLIACTFRRCFGSAPQKRSDTKSSCVDRCATTSFFNASYCAGDISPFFSHQICGSVVASFTTNLSFGDRPVCGFVIATKEPSDVS